jgi:GH25 family lysozyme M1 (1,4-beta-N-acetylmuramidase)
MAENGIDVSSYQPGIGNIGQQFVFVKATEGTTYANPYMQAQLATAPHKGLYHFASGGNVIAEANWFLAHWQKGTLPILDYEANALKLWTVDNVRQWLNYVYSKTGIKPLLYMSLAVENERDWSSCTGYPLWVAQYNTMAPQYGFQPRPLYGRLRNWHQAAVFQYHSNTYLPGWSGGLDVDVLLVPWSDLLTNNKKEDVEMSWHPQVKCNELGRFKVNRQQASLYADSTLSKQTGARQYGEEFKVFRAANGAVNVGDSQWFSQADGLTKINPLAVNVNAKAICKITAGDAWTQNLPTSGQPGIKHLIKGQAYAVHGRVGKYLLVGDTRTGKYIDGDKADIVL